MPRTYTMTVFMHIVYMHDSHTACLESTGCDRGQRLCYFDVRDNSDKCCPFYQDDVCVYECSHPLVPDSNFDCGEYSYMRVATSLDIYMKHTNVRNIYTINMSHVL